MKLFKKKKKKKKRVEDVMRDMAIARKVKPGEHVGYANPDGPMNRAERREQAKRMGLSYQQYKKMFSTKIKDV